MPHGRRGPPPGAHSGPEPSWSPQRRTGATASPGPGTQWPSRPERWLACGTWEGRRVRGHWPHSQRQIPLARLGPWPPPRPLPARAGDHHSPRPDPCPQPPCPTPPPPHHRQQEDQHKPRSITPPPGAAAAAPQEGGGGGWAASGGPWWKRRQVATAAKRSAPGAGGGGPNRAWAGGAGSRGLCRGAERAQAKMVAGSPARRSAGGGRRGRRKASLTGNRTRAAAVRAPNPNH